MPQSLIKLRICEGDSLFREALVLKNIGVSELKVLIYPWDAKLVIARNLKTRMLTSVR